jgi:hypothetical protein
MFIGIVNTLPGNSHLQPRPTPESPFDLITEIGVLIKSEAGQQLVSEQSP